MSKSERGGNYTALVELSDQKRMNTLFRHELGLYNGLIDIFESRTRVFPQLIFDITPTERKLFAEVAAHGLEWSKVPRKVSEWPASLAKVAREIREDVWKLHPQLDLMLQELSKLRGLAVLPEVKRVMVTSVMEFYHDQANILKDPHRSEILEVAYRATPMNLNRMDDRVKRHAQIPRTEVQIRYDNEADISYVKTPLNLKPIEVPGVNLNERRNWSTMIIRQESGKYVDYNTPWVVEFRQTNNKYLLKLVDIGSRFKSN